jgi:hypothetical protein
MRRAAPPFATTALIAAATACNALTGVADLHPCDTCIDDGRSARDGAPDAIAAVVDGSSPDAMDSPDATMAPDARSLDGGGDSGSGIGCQGAADCVRVVFATSTEYQGGAFGGVTGADAKCQFLADQSTQMRIKGRTFLAWISSSATSPAARLTHATSAYIRADGVVVASNWTDLTNGGLANGISFDELGNNRNNTGAWTGTNTVGATYTGNSCSDWTSSLGGVGGFKGERGNVGGSGSGWSGGAQDDCDAAHRLYCFEK